MKTIKRFFELTCAAAVVAAEHLCQCAKCSCNFDSSKVPEKSAGVVECPNCGTLLDENGACKVEDQAGKEIKAEDGDGDMDAKNATRQPALEAGGPGSGPHAGSNHEHLQAAIDSTKKWEEKNPISKDEHAKYSEKNEALSSALHEKGFHDAGQIQHGIAKYHQGRSEDMTHEKAADFAHAHVFSNKVVSASSAKPAASLQAGYNGNQHQSAKELAAEHSVAADTASKVAETASKAARNQDPSNKEGMHDQAFTMHTAAKSLHELAAQKHRSAGNEDCAKDHDDAAAGHSDEMQAHKGVIEACGGIAKAAPAATGAALASDATPAAGLQLDCSACVEAKNFKSVLNPIADGILMYMPAGTHEITPSQNGRPVTVTVAIDAAAADRLESQRRSLEASGKKPFFSVQHSTQIAAFWPAEFFWDTRLDATGSLVEGVWARGEWTRAGRDAVEGKDFRTFSPTFFVDAIRNDPARPVQVVCNDEAKANMGALENDAAFQKISPLWAHDASAPGSKTNMKKPDNISTGELVRMVHDELRASNPDLQDVVNALSFKYDMRVSSNDVAKALRGEALEAGGPGSGPRASGNSANDLSDAANKKSHEAVESGDAESHRVAAAAHTEAQVAHTRNAEKASISGDKEGSQASRSAAAEHGKAAWMHNMIAMKKESK